MGPGQPGRLVLDALGVGDLELLSPTHLRREIWPDHDLRVPPGLEAYLDLLGAHFPAERRGLAALAALAQRLHGESTALDSPLPRGALVNAGSLGPLSPLARSTAGAVVDAHLGNPRLRAVLDLFASGWLGLPLDRLSAIQWLIPGTRITPLAGAIPAAGARLSLALTAIITRAGGEVRLSTPARRIHVRRGRVTGVELDSGEILETRQAVSNVSPQQTFGRLVDPAAVEARYLARLARMEASVSCFKVWLGLDSSLDTSRAGGLEYDTYLAPSYDPPAGGAGSPDSQHLGGDPHLLEPAPRPAVALHRLHQHARGHRRLEHRRGRAPRAPRRRGRGLDRSRGDSALAWTPGSRRGAGDCHSSHLQNASRGTPEAACMAGPRASINAARPASITPHRLTVSTSRGRGRGPVGASPPRCDPDFALRATCFRGRVLVDQPRVTCYARTLERWRVERRNVLKMGAAAGVSGLASTGCATLGDGSLGTAAPPAMPDLDAFLARLDHGMRAIAAGNPLQDLLPKSQIPAAPGGPPRAEDLLIKKTLRSLLMAGSFRDLSDAERAHPAVQARMHSSMAEMDEAVFGMTHVLESFTPSERARIREAIQSEPDIGMRIAESLDTGASNADISLQRRTHLRAIAAQLTWRLKNQPIETAMDEYIGKVKKVSARNGYSEELQRKLAAQAVTAAFIAQAPPGAAPAQPGAPMQGAPGGGAAAPAPGASAQPAYPPGYGPPPAYPPGYGPPPAYVYLPDAPAYYAYPNAPPQPSTAPRGGAAITVGAILMGVGVTVGVIGVAVMGGGGIEGVFALTAGAVLLVAGLITLIVGLVLRAKST